MVLLRKHKLAILGAFAGAVGGYAYFYFVGCDSGTCMITSNPVNSTLYGAIMGSLFFNLFKKEKSNSES